MATRQKEIERRAERLAKLARLHAEIAVIRAELYPHGMPRAFTTRALRDAEEHRAVSDANVTGDMLRHGK